MTMPFHPATANIKDFFKKTMVDAETKEHDATRGGPKVAYWTVWINERVAIGVPPPVVQIPGQRRLRKRFPLFTSEVS